MKFGSIAHAAQSILATKVTSTSSLISGMPFIRHGGHLALQNGLWEDDPMHLRSRGTNGTVVEIPRPWYYTWAELRLQNLYDRRPETMPLPSSMSPEPNHYDDDEV